MFCISSCMQDSSFKTPGRVSMIESGAVKTNPVISSNVTSLSGQFFNGSTSNSAKVQRLRDEMKKSAKNIWKNDIFLLRFSRSQLYSRNIFGFFRNTFCYFFKVFFRKIKLFCYF